MLIVNELTDSIKSFEETYAKYLNPDGTLNREGYKILCSANMKIGDKHASYEAYHMNPRLKKYWNDPKADVAYKKAWKKLHEKMFCTDCKKEVETWDDPCPIHKNCGDVAKRCSECNSLNVEVRKC